MPLAGVRVRKAVQSGAKVAHLNPVDYDFHFETNHQLISAPQELPLDLGKILVACIDGKLDKLPEAIRPLLMGLEPEAIHRKIADMLTSEKSVMLTGALFENHPQASLLRTLVALLKEHSHAHRVHFSTGANAAGACPWQAFCHIGEQLEKEKRRPDMMYKQHCLKI